MTMGNPVAVLKDGQLQQCHAPCTLAYVAGPQTMLGVEQVRNV